MIHKLLLIVTKYKIRPKYFKLKELGSCYICFRLTWTLDINITSEMFRFREHFAVSTPKFEITVEILEGNFYVLRLHEVLSLLLDGNITVTSKWSNLKLEVDSKMPKIYVRRQMVGLTAQLFLYVTHSNHQCFKIPFWN